MAPLGGHYSKHCWTGVSFLNVLLLSHENFGCTRVLLLSPLLLLYLLHIHILTARAALVEQFKKDRAESNARRL